MHEYQIRVISGLGELGRLRPEWNQLWANSFTRQPTVRAEGIDHWVRSFGENRAFFAVCVESEDAVVAALPLLRDDRRGIYPVYKLPVNCWANSGDLLIDRSVAVNSVLDVLVQGLEHLSASRLSLEEITLESPQWTGFQSAVHRRGGQFHVANEAPVGVVDVLHDWQRYERSWSANHRGAVKRSHRKLQKRGEVRLERFRSPEAGQLTDLMCRAFEIENRSWKGEAGSSVMSTNGMVDYMLREAELVCNAGHLDLWFLYCGDEPVSFEYCHYAKGTCFSHKIGYDPDFSQYGPGRLLRYLQLQQYHEDPDCHLFDMLGTLCDSKAKWATRTCRVGHVYASIGNAISNLILQGYAWTRPKVRAIRGRATPAFPSVGASDCLPTPFSSPVE